MKYSALICILLHGSAWADPKPSPLAARPYATRLPGGQEPGRPAPLLVLLHGYGDDAAGFAAAIGDPLPGAIVVAPEGTLDARGHRFWNASAACCDFDRRGPDDVAYLDAVIADARARHQVDPRRIYVLGFSNGGFMAHRMACAARQPIAALASIAGAPGEAACAPPAPRALLEVHGRADPVVPVAGGTLGGGLPAVGRFPPARAGLAAWARAIGCTGEESSRSDGVLRWRCPRGAAELRMVDGGHAPGPAAVAAAAAFLAAHPAR